MLKKLNSLRLQTGRPKSDKQIHQPLRPVAQGKAAPVPGQPAGRGAQLSQAALLLDVYKRQTIPFWRGCGIPLPATGWWR